MNNFLKKSFLVSMVLMTALWGVLGVVAPVVHANVSQAGDLIRTAQLSAVYYVDANNVRHSFPDQRVFNSWYKDFKTVKTVSTDEMLSYSTGSSVVVRPGTKLVQYVSILADNTFSTLNTPDVFAVGPNGELHKIDSAATAVSMYGANWEKMIVPVPEYLGGNYHIGSVLTSSSMYPDGTLVKTADASQIYVIWNGQKRPVTDAGFTANMFNNSFVVTASSLASYPAGTSVTAKEDALAQPMAGAGVVVGGTGLTVALAAGNPTQQVAPIGASSVELMRFSLTASADGAVTVNQVNVKRNGVGQTSDWSNAYLYDGSVRLGSGKSFNSTSQLAQFVNLGLTIPAGSTKTISLRGDVCTTSGSLCGANATSGNIHYFTLESGSITTASGATINGSFPLMSSVTTIGSTAVGSITAAVNGSLSNPTVGQTGATVAEFKLSAGSEDIKVSRIALYQAGSINNSYLTNFKLMQGSTQVGSAAGIGAKSLVTFDLSAAPFVIAKNQDRIFDVIADVSSSARPNDSMKFYLDQTTDLYAVGAFYGYGANVIDTSYDGGTACTGTEPDLTCSDASYTYIKGGQVNVVKNGPAATNMAINVNNQKLLNFTITTAVPTEIRNWRVEIHNSGTDLDTADTNVCSSSTSYLANIRIAATDGSFTTDSKDICSFANVNGVNTGLYATYTDTLTMPAGTSKTFDVIVDSKTGLGTAGSYYAVLGDSLAGSTYTFSATAVKNTDNNQYVTDIVPSSFLQGNNMTYNSASVTTALGNYQGNQTVVRGSNGVELLEYNVTAGTGSDIKVNTVKFAAYIDQDNNGTATLNTEGGRYVRDVVDNLKLYVKDGSTYTQIGTAQSVSSGYATFNNLNWTLPAGSTKTLALKGDVNPSAYYDSNAEQIAFDIFNTAAGVGGIVAVDSSSNSVATITAQMNGSAGSTTTVTDTSMTTRITTSAGGNLYVANNDSPTSANMVAGTAGQTVLKLRFNAVNEAFNIKKLRIVQNQPSVNGGDRSVNAVKITYTNQAGATVTSSQSLAGGIANFDVSANPIYVPANDVATVDVTADLRAISSNSADAKSGDQVTFGFDKDNNFDATGTGNTHLTDGWSDGSDVNANVMTIRKALPTFSSVALSTTGLVPGQVQEFYKFRVTASQGSSIDLKKVHLKTTLTGGGTGKASIALDQISLKEDDLTLTGGDTGTDTYRVYSGVASTATANSVLSNDVAGLLSSTAGAQNLFVVFNDDRTISAGNSKVYTLSGMIAYGSGSTNAASYGVSTYLYDPMSAAYNATTNPDANVATRALGYIEPYCNNADALGGYSKYCLANSAGTGDKDASYIWSDHSGTDGNNVHTDAATGHTGSSNDWTNGYLLKTLGQGTSLGLTKDNN